MGGSERVILSRTLIGLISWKGGFMSASSIRVMPALQMSAWREVGGREGDEGRGIEIEG